MVEVSHVEVGNTCPPSSVIAATHSVHVTKDLYNRPIGAPDPVVARGTAGGQHTTGCSRHTTESGYNGVKYLILDILGYFISQLFACTIWRTDWTSGSDHSGRVGEGEGGIIASSRGFSITGSS